MKDSSWAVEQVKGWGETNTNSLNPQFKECLDITVSLAETAIRLAASLSDIQSSLIVGTRQQ